jgi:hypothetical protein
MNIEQLFEKILPFAETTLKENTSRNAKLLKAFIDSFPNLNVSDQNKFDLSELIEYYQSIKDWIESNEVEKFLAPLPIQNIENEFQKLLSELPEKLELPYLSQDHLPEINGKKIIKNLGRFAYNFKSKRYFKLILKNSKKTKGREIILVDFLKYYLLIPLIEQLYSEHNEFLHLLAQIKHQVHESSEKLKNDILLVQNVESNEQYWSNFKEQDFGKKTSIFIQARSIFKSTHTDYKKNVGKETKEFIVNLKNNISDAWKIADSPLSTKRSFNLSTTKKYLKVFENKQNKDIKKWTNHFKGDNEEWLKDLELFNLQLLAAQYHEETLNIIEKKTQASILPDFEDIKKTVTKTSEIFNKQHNTTEEKLRSTILVENRSLIKYLRQNKLPALTDAIIQANFSQAFGGFFQRIQSTAENLSDEHSVFTKKDISNIPPQSEIVDIPLKELVEDEILGSAFKSRDELVDKIDLQMKSLLHKINNLDQIVEFNLEAAHDMLKEDGQKDILEQAQKIASDGLERTQSNIEELQSDFLETIEASTKYFGEITLKLEIDVQKLCDNEKNLELKIRLARAKTKEKFIQTRRLIWKKISAFFPEIIRFTKSFLTRIRKEYFKIRKVTGLGPQITSSEAALTQFLIDTQRKIKKMPYIYQRLFRLEPLEEKRFFYGRAAQMDYLKDDFESFKDGNQAATAIVGEKGNGKTTILKFAEKEFFAGFSVSKIDLASTVHEEKEVLTILSNAFNLSDAGSIADLENMLLADNKKRICIIENLQNMFLRIINGFDSLEKLLLLISKTRHQIFWVVSSGLYAWEFLDKVINISDYFKRTIFLEALAKDEIKDVILNRHQVSGYGLSFQVSEKVSKSRPYKKLNSVTEQQEYLKNLLFDDLANVSGGNIKSAILFWLSVLQDFDEEKIDVGEKISLDHSHIYQLPPLDLFSLAAFVEHEYLNEEQHALIFNQDLNDSELIISRLYKRGYLEKVGDKYAVYPLLYRPVIKALKSKNILL